MQAQLDDKIANLCDKPVPDSFLQPAVVKKIPEPTKAEIGHVLHWFYAALSKCQIKLIALTM